MMMRRIGYVLVASLLALPAFTLLAQPATPPAPGGKKGIEVPKTVADAELLRVEKESFSVAEIAAAYDRGISGDAPTFYELPRDSALAFINLYADFRMKVRAATDMGLDKSAQFLQDMERNRDQVALGISPYGGGISGDGYLFQRRLVDPGARTIFTRRNEERKVAVIFSAMNAENPADTLRAWNRSVSMLKLLKGGASFEALAADSSNDATTNQKGGVIGWITGGMVLRELEDAAWSTKPGQIYPQIIKLSSGYVLMKVLAAEERRKVRAAHILFNITKNINSQTNEEEARKKAQDALDRIRGGEDFAVVAAQTSEDKTSGANGGDLLSWYTRSLGFEARAGKLTPEIEDAIFRLKDGETSGLVKSEYGYHIVKRLESRIPTFEEEEKAIRDIYKRLFMENDRQKYMEEVLKKQGLKIDLTSFEALAMSVDTNRSAADTAWASHITKNLRNRELFSFQGKSYTVGSWVDSVETNPRLRGMPLNREGIRGSIRTLAEYPALKEEAKTLEKEYPDFARLMGEFHDGALIFELEQQKIYSKVSYDEQEGQKFFKEHQKDYMSAPKLALSEIFIYTESNANDLHRRASKGEDFSALATNYTERQGFREKAGKWNMSEPKHSELVRKVLEISSSPSEGTILKPIPFQGGWSIVRIDQVEKPHPMTYEEARGEVMADFNDWKEKTLRKEMLASFRSKYSVTVNNAALDAALRLQ